MLKLCYSLKLLGWHGNHTEQLWPQTITQLLGYETKTTYDDLKMR